MALAQIKLVGLLSYWAMLLWPGVLVGGVTYFRRRKLVKLPLFFGIATLSCYGTMFLVSQLHAYWFIPLAASTPSDRLIATVTGAVLGMTVVGIAASILPLWAMYRGWRNFSEISTSNQRLERP